MGLLAALGLWRIGAKSLWLDEGVSVAFVRSSWPDLTGILWDIEINMAAYHILLWVWKAIGTDEAAVRSLSVVFAVATLPLVYRLAHRVYCRRTATIAALLMATHGFVVEWAQNARGYTMAMFLSCLSTACFIAAVEKNRGRWWLSYVAVTALGLYSHLFVGLVVLAHGASFLLVPTHIARKRILGITVSFVALAAASLPIVRFVAVRGTSPIDWLEDPSLADAGEALGSLVGNGGRFLTILAALVLAKTVWNEGTLLLTNGRSVDTWQRGLILLWFVVPFVAAYALSFVLEPVFLDQYLIVSLAATVMVLGAGLATIRWRGLAALITVVIVILSLRGAVDWYRQPPRQDFRLAAEVIEDGMDEGAIVLVSPPYLLEPLLYYVEERVPTPLVASRFATTGTGAGLTWISGDPLFMGDVLERPEVWLVTGLQGRQSDEWLLGELAANRPPGIAHEVSGLSIVEFSR